MTWSPVRLPRACRQTANYILNGHDGMAVSVLAQAEHHDPWVRAISSTDRGNVIATELQRIAGHLQAAELYWATSDMSALAVAAGATLPDIDLSEPPSPIGLIVFDGGIGSINTPQAVFGPPARTPYEAVMNYTTHALPVIPVNALSWGPGPGGTLAVWMWMHTRHLLDAILDAGQEPAKQVPPLMPVAGDNLARAAFSNAAGDVPGTTLRALSAAWHLLQQPTLVETSTAQPSKAAMRSLQRAGASHDVTLIDLRHAYIPDRTEDPGEGEGRIYRHRWVVSGHWRNQAHGPERSLRRRQWIPAYVKGPDGAPLLATERVNVWRR